MSGEEETNSSSSSDQNDSKLPTGDGAVETVSLNSEVIINAEDAILEGLHESLNRSEKETSYDDIVRILMQSLQVGNPEIKQADLEELARSLLFVIRYKIDYSQHTESESDEELVSLLSRLVSRFSDDIRIAEIRKVQGRQFWRSIDTEMVIREERESVGFHHIIKKDFGETVELSNDFASNQSLIQHLIDDQIQGINTFGMEQFASQVRPGQIEKLKESIEELEEKYSEYIER